MVWYIEQQRLYKNVSFALNTGQGRLQAQHFLRSEMMENTTITLLEEIYYWRTYNFYLFPFNQIYEALDEFVLDCHQYGFFEFFMSNYTLKPAMIKNSTPQPLSMNMLSAGFYLCLMAFFASFVIFVSEFIIYFGVKMYKKYKTQKIEKLNVNNKKYRLVKMIKNRKWKKKHLEKCRKLMKKLFSKK